MYKTLFSFALALAASVGAWAQSATEAVVTATLNGIPDGTVIEVLPSATHRTEKAVATAAVKDGKVVLTIPVTEARQFGVLPKDGYYLFHLVTCGGESVSVTLDAQPYGDEQDKFMSSNIKITGSPMNAEFDKRFTSVRASLDDLYQSYHDQYKDVLDEKDAAWRAKDSVKYKEILASARYKEFAKAEDDFFHTVESTYKQMFRDNADSWWGALVMLNAYSYFTEEQKADWDLLSDAAKTSFYGKILDEQINPKGFKGENLPTFDLQQVDGSKQPMASAVESARYYLVDFWASWCGPCRKEIPNLKALYELYKGKGLQIVSVSIDKDEAAWKKALGEEKLPWPNGIDRAGIADAYKVKFIPAIFLVDGATGKCIAENIRGEELATKLADLFGAK